MVQRKIDIVDNEDDEHELFALIHAEESVGLANQVSFGLGRVDLLLEASVNDLGGVDYPIAMDAFRPFPGMELEIPLVASELSITQDVMRQTFRPTTTIEDASIIENDAVVP